MAIKEVTVQGETIRFGVHHLTAPMPGLARVVRDLFVQNEITELYVAEVRNAIMGFDGADITPGARYNELIRTFTDGVEIGGKLFVIEDEGKKKMYAKTKKIVMRDGRLDGPVARAKPVLRQWTPGQSHPVVVPIEQGARPYVRVDAPAPASDANMYVSKEEFALMQQRLDKFDKNYMALFRAVFGQALTGAREPELSDLS